MLAALGHILFGFFGLFVLVLIAYTFSNNRRSVDWKLVLTGISLQILFAAFVLKVPFGSAAFDALGMASEVAAPDAAFAGQFRIAKVAGLV